MKHGGYGFHAIWRNIDNLFTPKNVKWIREQLTNPSTKLWLMQRINAYPVAPNHSPKLISYSGWHQTQFSYGVHLQSHGLWTDPP